MAKKKKKGQRADGLVEIKRKMADGSYKHFYGTSKADCEAKYREALIEQAQKKKVSASFQFIATAYEDYITGPQTPVRRGTINAYRKHIGPLKKYFGDTPMEEIDPHAVRGYLEQLKKQGKAQKTVTNARSVLSCIFSYWCAEYHGTANPVDLAGLPSGLRRGKRAEPTQEQIDRINAHPEGAGFWAQLFSHTGARLAEANALRWADVDFEAGTITIDDAQPWDHNQPYAEDTKSERGHRVVPILDDFRPLLERERQGHAPTDFILSGQAKPLTASQYSRRWTMYCRSIGLAQSTDHLITIKATGSRPQRTAVRKEWKAEVTAHQFRHQYATTLFYAGVPDLIAQQLLGHADITTTRRVYQHFRDQEQGQYTDLINDYLRSKKAE